MGLSPGQHVGPYEIVAPLVLAGAAAGSRLMKPELVFAASSGPYPLDVSQYDIARDGRLLIAIEDPASRRSRTILMQNWSELVTVR